MSPLSQASLFRDAADVQRFHCKRTLRDQTVGQHSFNMVTLLLIVAPDARKEVFQTIVHHDLPELFTGDMPGPFKRAHWQIGQLMEEAEKDLEPLYREFGLNAAEQALVKMLDRIEGAMWALEEVRMGNSYARSTVARYLGWLLASHVPSDLGESGICDASLLLAELVQAAKGQGIEPHSGATLEQRV